VDLVEVLAGEYEQNPDIPALKMPPSLLGNRFEDDPVTHNPAIPSHQPAVFHPNRCQRGFRQGGVLLAVPFPCLAASA